MTGQPPLAPNSEPVSELHRAQPLVIVLIVTDAAGVNHELSASADGELILPLQHVVICTSAITLPFESQPQGSTTSSSTDIVSATNEPVSTTSQENLCISFDDNCTACLRSSDPGPTWGSPCVYLSAAAQGHRCQPAKWWAKYAGRFSCVRPVVICTPPVTCGAVGSARAGCWSGVWSAHDGTPSPCDPCPGADTVPTASLPHGPLLGDGETGVVFGVDKGALTGYITANSYWLYNRDTWGHSGRSEQRGIGGVTMSIADENGEPLVPAPRYTLEQSLENGTVRFSLWPDCHTGSPLLAGIVTIAQGAGGDSTSAGGATSTLVATLTGGDRSLEVTWKTWVYSSAGSNSSSGAADDILYATRQLHGTQRPVVAVLASRRLSALAAGRHATGGGEGGGGGGGALNFSVVPGKSPVTIITSILTSVTTGSATLNDTLARTLQSNRRTHPIATAAQAARFWQAFWAQSSITLPPKWATVEQYWYSAQYLMGMASRAGRIAPAIWGPWMSTDRAEWGGGYTLDYNYEMPFQHLFSSNRASIADSFYPIVLQYGRRNGGHEAALKANGACNASGGVKGMPGAVHFTVKIAPGGLASSQDDDIHFNGLFASLNFISAFEFSQNVTFLTEDSYPLLRAVAAWYVGDGTSGCAGWLTKEPLSGDDANYRYNDNNTCTQEDCWPKGTKDLNPAISISFLMRLLLHLVHVSERGLVNPPAEELARWRDTLQHLAAIPVGNATSPLEAVLLPQELPVFTYPAETNNMPLQFSAVFPGEQIGLGSAPELLAAARNTMLRSGFTHDDIQENSFQAIYPAFVRVGCASACTLNATWILGQISAVVSRRMGANGYLRQGGGGIETAGGAVAINDMLLMSFEGFLRFFPVWPPADDASFTSLRAVGAFLVSASIRSTVVVDVEVTSEAGRNCTFLSPWQRASAEPPVVTSASGERLVVVRATSPLGATSLWRFATVAGGVYTVVPGHT